ncbi:hypothetical protein COSHB9_08910 [Companilactobacillus alimentarius]|uniref:Uncharacterized protein n=1 Tax=Companilactobacillus alimentarius DSM 20249 TaxID=1423720 RepID=A0A2K9HKA3_9LACO|nr:hypothetical protein [Companilactobacillus alimentarius]AUI72167.1 hypothetical protein LA20249_08215 [Companilactobacillus alimentarius DSM 20249]KRK76230.1 lipoprotein [Companilactobacillus alimentarius DSM 20249]MDT6952708.1 hypothetical protein [Companilactobacillus alimentarius]GEO45798.1 hypothetical protein LAL01_20300 [Companilactobacillus alimentarius]
MHKNYREPIKVKYLIISIIGVIIFATVLSFFTLKTPTQTTTSQSKVNYVKIKRGLDHQFNSNGDVAQIKQEDNIHDKNGKNPHTVIIVKLTDKQTQKYIKTTYEAVRNNKATNDQKLYIASIQHIIATQAKKLKNNNDVIQFVYKDGKNYVLVASSQKHRNLIPLVKTN